MPTEAYLVKTPPEGYLDRLCSHLGSLPGFERDWWTGGVRSAFSPTQDLWASPGWDGLPGLPWSLEGEGDVPAWGTEPVEWTGDLEQDTALYRAAVARVAARLRGAVARGPAYRRVGWYDAYWAQPALGVGPRAAEDAPIPGVVHRGDYVLVLDRYLDEPQRWPLVTLIVETD